MRLLSVVQHLDQPKLEVVIEDDQNHRRRIDYTWMSKDILSVPDNWLEAVQGEIEYQRSDELAIATGRKLPY